MVGFCDILPSNVNLWRKKIQITPSCNACGFSFETNFHTIIFCVKEQMIFGIRCYLKSRVLILL